MCRSGAELLTELLRLTGRPCWENAVHDLSATLDRRTELLTVDGLGDHGGAVADQPGDTLDRHSRIGQQRHKAMPQLARCPLSASQPGHVHDLAEVTPHDVRQSLGLCAVDACPALL